VHQEGFWPKRLPGLRPGRVGNPNASLLSGRRESRKRFTRCRTETKVRPKDGVTPWAQFVGSIVNRLRIFPSGSFPCDTGSLNHALSLDEQSQRSSDLRTRPRPDSRNPREKKPGSKCDHARHGDRCSSSCFLAELPRGLSSSISILRQEGAPPLVLFPQSPEFQAKWFVSPPT